MISVRESGCLERGLSCLALMKVVAGQGSECLKDHVLSRAQICLINRIQDGLSVSTH